MLPYAEVICRLGGYSGNCSRPAITPAFSPLRSASGRLSRNSVGWSAAIGRWLDLSPVQSVPFQRHSERTRRGRNAGNTQHLTGA